MPKQPQNRETEEALCDFLRALDCIALENVPRLMKGNASPMTIDRMTNIVAALNRFEGACERQYGNNDNLTDIEMWTMHNDPRDPGPDDELTE